LFGSPSTRSKHLVDYSTTETGTEDTETESYCAHHVKVIGGLERMVEEMIEEATRIRIPMNPTKWEYFLVSSSGARCSVMEASCWQKWVRNLAVARTNSKIGLVVNGINSTATAANL